MIRTDEDMTWEWMMPWRQKDEAPGQSEEYPTVNNLTRIMVDGMLSEGAVNIF